MKSELGLIKPLLEGCCVHRWDRKRHKSVMEGIWSPNLPNQICELPSVVTLCAIPRLHIIFLKIILYEV